MRPSQAKFVRPPEPFFLHEFRRRMHARGQWYRSIAEKQIAVAEAIEALDEPYDVRERMMQSLELTTRLLFLHRRAVGFGLFLSVVLNVALLWDVSIAIVQRFPTWPALLIGLVSGLVRIILLLGAEKVLTWMTTFSGWYRRERENICQDALRLDQADRNAFRSDLVLMSTTNRDNQRAASVLFDYVNTHRPS